MRLITRFHLAVTALAARLAAPRPARLVVTTSGRTRRGAGLIEYMLLAFLAVVLFALLRVAFPAIFDNIIDKIKTAVGM